MCRHHFPGNCRHLALHGVVNLGGVVKTLRRSNSLSRSVFSTAGSFGQEEEEEQGLMAQEEDTHREERTPRQQSRQWQCPSRSTTTSRFHTSTAIGGAGNPGPHSPVCVHPIPFFSKDFSRRTSSGGWDGWWLERPFLGRPDFSPKPWKTLHFSTKRCKIGVPQNGRSNHHPSHPPLDVLLFRGPAKRNTLVFFYGGFSFFLQIARVGGPGI